MVISDLAGGSMLGVLILITILTGILAGLSALFIALLTVSYQAIRAAIFDPVKSLRYE